MRLYVVQHGEAVPKDVDPDRPLSDRGRHDIERLGRFLSSHDVRVSQILHSGKTRARETAEILRPVLDASGQVREQSGLAPNDPPEAFLEQLKDVNDILIASHMPFVTRTVSRALTGGPDQDLLEFRPGSVAGIERAESGSWHLFMFVRPEFS